MAKNLEAFKLGVVIDANAANALKAFAATDKAASGLAQRFKSLKNAGESLARIGVGWSATVTAPLALLGKGAIDAAKDFDSLTRGMTAVSGSAEAAKAEILKLKEVAKLPGLGFKEAIQGSISLQAAGFSADLARRSLGAFGNALATVGKGKADLDGVSLALSQIASKGKISAEEINQIAERVPQIRKAMQAAFGTADTEKLQKMGIDATAFVTRMVAELGKLPKAGGGAANAFENLGDSINQALVPVGNVLLKAIIPAIDFLAPKLEAFSQKFSELSPTTQALAVGAGVFAAALGPVLIALGAITAAIGTLGAPAVATIVGLSAAATALGAAWATNFGGIREATAQVFGEVRKIATEQIAIIVAWWKENLPLIKQTVQTVLNAVKAFWANHGAEITSIIKTSWQIVSTTIGTAIKAILGAIKLGMQVINGDWGGAWKTFLNVVASAQQGVEKVLGLLVKRAYETLKLIFSALAELTTFVLAKMVGLGVAIVDGVIQGIKSSASKLWTATKEMAMSAYQSAKAALGVQSPSRVFAELGRNVVEGFLLGIRLKASDVKKALVDLLKDATATATAIALLSNPLVFAAKNRNADLQEQLSRAEELFALRRDASGRGNAPNIPISGAFPQGDAAVRAQLDYLNALKGLSDAVARTRAGELINLALPDSAIDAPNTIREITEAIDEQIKSAAKATDTYEDIKKGLQGVIESYEGLTAAQRLQRRIAELPDDAPPQQRAELESLFGIAREAEQRDEAQRERKDGTARKPPGFFERVGIGGGLFGDSGGEKIPGLAEVQGATAGMKGALDELKTIGAEAFGQLAQGAGSLLQDWILMGDVGPDALRKITAQILASASAESAVLAIIETAKGFAALASGNPVSASQHFTSAAIFGAVAGGAAIAGRALAGNRFNGNNQQAGNNGENRDVTSESYAGNQFRREVNESFKISHQMNQATYASSNNGRTEQLLDAINNKLNPVNGQQMVLATLANNPRAVAQSAVAGVNGDFATGNRLGQRISG